jgi:superfamily II DNA helicase RecQ
VECIHSGRDRADSRQICPDYLNGKLQFLFIAPEGLRVSGFVEMLAKRKPALVAIDEAHYIWQWGWRTSVSRTVARVVINIWMSHTSRH